MRALLLASLLAASVLAGCANPTEPGYGAYYAASVTGAFGCTVHLPWPLEGVQPWDAVPTALTGTTAGVVTTDHGIALKLSGAGGLGANASESARSPLLYNLSMPQEPYAEAGPRVEGTHWVKADACAGAELELTWVHDGDPKGVSYAARQILADGWQQLTVVKADF